MPAPARITVRDVAAGDLREPALTNVDREDYLAGWELFNRGEYWHAHEAWEAVWKRHPEPWRLFLEGIIQLAAAYHLLTVKRRFSGMMGNFAKAEEKLRLFERVPPDAGMKAGMESEPLVVRANYPGSFLGVDVRALLRGIEAARRETERLGARNLEEFPTALLPRVVCALPSPLRGSSRRP
jgi:hypothetical protein